LDGSSAPPPPQTLADKLGHLFQTVVPAGRGPYSVEEVAKTITDSGVPISGSYIWLLRKGQRDNPTLRHLTALARFFGVPPAYFFDDSVTSDVAAGHRGQGGGSEGRRSLAQESRLDPGGH
jgi:transcriptional regulator with XRE-family HTH domain